MKQALRLAVAALCVTLVSLATATAQDQYTEGQVDRVVLVHILPGHFNAFMDDVKNNIKPIWDAEKKAGLIEGYGIFLNQTKASVDDWDIGFELTYKNMAALDGLAMKVLELRMKQYGDRAPRGSALRHGDARDLCRRAQLRFNQRRSNLRRRRAPVPLCLALPRTIWVAMSPQERGAEIGPHRPRVLRGAAATARVAGERRLAFEPEQFAGGLRGEPCQTRRHRVGIHPLAMRGGAEIVALRRVPPAQVQRIGTRRHRRRLYAFAGTEGAAFARQDRRHIFFEWHFDGGRFHALFQGYGRGGEGGGEDQRQQDA